MNIKKLTYTGLFTALIFIATFTIRIPVPFTNGYVHAGDSMIFVAAMLLDVKYAVFAAGVGSMLSDLIGYPHWALPTLIIKSIMALIIGLVVKKSKNNFKSAVLFSGTASLIWFIFLFILKIIMKAKITVNSTNLVNEVDGVKTMQELLSLNEKVQNQILTAAIIIPILIIIMLIIVNKNVNTSLKINETLGMTIAGLWMVIGYYFMGYILYGNYISPIFSIPWNIVQFVIGYLIAILIITALNKTPIKKAQ